MSEEIMGAAEIARLTTEVRGLRAALEQKERAIEAERRARELAQADLGWWHATVANYVTSANSTDRELLRFTMAEALPQLHPGASLLAELEAARALAAYLNDRHHWSLNTICPTCGFGTKLDGSEFHGTGCPLDTYNKASKAA